MPQDYPTAPPKTAENPTYSPDGGRLAFTSTTAGGEGIYLMNSGGGSPLLLTGTSESARDPAWSPDGTWIVYALLSSSLGRPPGLWVRNSADGTEFRIPNSVTWDYRPSFAPDGQSILFTGGSGTNQEIFTINTNGTGRTIFLGGPRTDRGAKWSPAGDRVVFYSDRTGSFEIYLHDVVTTNTIRLTTNSVTDWHPVWSPDGSMILYETVEGGVSKIAVMRSDGSGKTILATGSFPSWSVAPTVVTPVGNPVTVTSAVTTVNFSNVTAGGTTTVQPVPPNLQNLRPPGYFSIPTAGMGFEITTTASNVGPITLCFTLPATTSSNAFQLARVLHLENGVMVDRTILSGPNAPNFTNKTLCAEVTSLSPFALAMLADPQLAMIQGVVVDSSGSPMPDVLVELDGSEALSLLTGIDGAFTFVNLAPATSYTIKASRSGFTFSPALGVLDDLTGTNAMVFVGQVEFGPALTIDQTSLPPGQFRLTWPLQPGGYLLEQTEDLRTFWILTPETPIVTNGQHQVSLPTGAPTRFFRLRKE